MPSRSTNTTRSGRTRRARVAVYAGSFDPVTLGHMYVIREGARLFDRLIVAVGVNPAKTYSFSRDERLRLLRQCTRTISGIEIAEFGHQFLVDYAQSVGATHILRGIRNAQDFENERRMCQVNSDLNGAVTTVFLMPPRVYAEISSSFVKSLVGPKGWASVVRKYIPRPAFNLFLKRFQK